MRKTLQYVLAAVVVLSFASLAQAAGPQKAGKWRLTIEMEMAGMPMKIPPITRDICVTEEDAKDPQKAVPNDPKSGCKINDYKVEGNKVSWTIDCPKQKTTGSGEITYTENSYSGWTKMKVQDHDMTQKYAGKWLGACDK
jgi:hypothetical protein